MPKLVITDSEGSRTLALERETKAGRLAENEIQLKVPEASRHHCRFFAEQGSWFVEDMGSSNGTLVNGRKVSKFELQDGDLISVGAVTLRFMDTAATPEEKGEAAAGWGDEELSLEEPEPAKPSKAAAAAAVEDLAEEQEEAEVAVAARAHTRMVDTGSAFDDPTFALHDVPEVKKSVLPSIFAIVLLLGLAGGAAWLYMNRERLAGEQGPAGNSVKFTSNLVPAKFWSFEPHDVDNPDDQAGWHKDDAIDSASVGEVQDPVASGDQAWSISRRAASEKAAPATWVSLSGSAECDISITPGKVYKLRGLAAVDSARAIPGIGVTWIEPVGEEVHEVAREVVPGAPAPGKKFTELSGLVQAPEGATRARVAVVAGGSGDATFDDIVFDSAGAAPGREADVRGFRAWLTPSGALRIFHFARPVSDGIGIWKPTEGGFEPPSQSFVPKAGAGDAIAGTLRDGGGEISASLAPADSSFRATWKLGAAPGYALLIPLPGSAEEINVTLLEGETARRMRAAFQKIEACGVIVGGQGDRVRIKFKDGEDKPFSAPVDVVVDSGRAFLKVDRGDRGTVVFECELSFDAEMALARTLLAKADDARRNGRIGESVAAYEEVLAKFPFDENLEKQASADRERIMNDGRDHIRVLSAKVDDAKFFRTARLEDDLLGELEADVNRYSGTNLQAELAAKRDELKAERTRTASEKRAEEAKALLFRAQDYASGPQPRKEFAIAFLEMLIARYPDSEWAEHGRQLLEKLKSGAPVAPESRGDGVTLMGKTCIGIDLGSRNLRLVAGTIKGSVFTVTKIAQAEVKPSDDPESAILAALPDLAMELGDKLKKKANGARFGLSGKELIIRYTQVPPVPLWRLRLLMEFEVREMAQQAGDSLASDYNLVTLPNASGEDTVLVAVCKESFLASRFEAVKSAIGDPESALPASLALFNAFVGSGDIHEGEYTFLVDLGDRNVELALQKDGELIFARNIATGGRALTEAIAGALNTSVEDAEGLKHQFGSVTTRGLATYTSGREEKVGNAIIGPVGQLSAMIQSSLAFIRAQTKIRDLEVGRILLSGGGANLRGLPEYLGAAFHCPVGRFQPEAGLDLTQLPADEAALFQTDPGSFAVALGLARTSADAGAFKLDLVPQPVHKKRKFAQRTIFLWLAGAAALIFLGLTTWRGMKTVGELETQASIEKRNAETARSRRKLYDSEQARIGDLNAKMAYLSGYTEPAWALLTVQSLVQQSRPESVWIQSISVKREMVTDPANPKIRTQKTKVKVTGMATAMDMQPDQALGALKQGIEAARKGTEVLITKQTPATRGGPIEFELTVELKDPS